MSKSFAGDIVRLRDCSCDALVLACGSEKQTGRASEQHRALRTELECYCANTTFRVVGEPCARNICSSADWL